MNQIQQALGVSTERHEELSREVVEALKAGDEATAKLLAKYDAESCIIGMQYVTAMMAAIAERRRRRIREWDMRTRELLASKQNAAMN